jgi:uncharacterized membrane protein
MSRWYQMVILMLILKSIVLMMITVYLVSVRKQLSRKEAERCAVPIRNVCN